MRDRRSRLRTAGVAAVVVLAFGWASPAWAPLCTYCTTSGLLLSLPSPSSVSVPPNPCVGALGESVSLAGEVHVVTKVGLNFVTDVYLNMAGVSGVGQTTGTCISGPGRTGFSAFS
jgi:hypothetical protein